MPIDENVFGQRFRDVAASAVAGVEPSPGLLAAVRRRHTTRRRRQAVAVPLAAAAVTGGVVSAAAATRGSGGGSGDASIAASPTPSPSASNADGVRARALDLTFQLPAGWVVDRRTPVIDLSKAQPPQPVAGTDQSFTASQLHGAASMDVTVYRGPIADAEAKLQFPWPARTTVATVGPNTIRIGRAGADTGCTVISATPRSPSPSPPSDALPSMTVPVRPTPAIHGGCVVVGNPNDPESGFIQAVSRTATGETILVDATGADAQTVVDLIASALGH